ncbi:MAG TPA: penicillin-binding transpeptidase domain-containing protein [Frankiaceae bacterium]|nr:penicillin-binding transpeptidase domain-containing protein [Frankiaceae bacterium]
MAVNRRYGPSTDGKPADKTTDFVHTKLSMPTDPDSFSPGSTFKVFTLIAAIEQGLPLSTTFNAPACYESAIYVNPPGNNCPEDPSGTGFRNAGDSEAGVFSLTTATWDSVNTYFIQLEERVGVLKVAEMARRLGVTSYRLRPYGEDDKGGVSDGEGSLTLGSHEASTLDMATAYATLAARGLRCYPRPVLSVTGGGRPVSYGAPEPCRQVVRPEVADTVSSVLQGVINRGTAARNGPIGRPAAGKTGTAENHSDAWFVGYVPQVAAAVTVADPRGTTKYPLQVSPYPPEGVPVPGWDARRPVFGGDLPTQIWARTMRDVLARENIPAVPLPPPDDTQPATSKVGVPDVVGQGLRAALVTLRGAGLSAHVGVAGGRGRRGTVVRTDPPPGAQVELGSSVTLFVARSGQGAQPLPAWAPPRRGAAGGTPFPLPAGPPILVTAGGTGR